MERSLDSGDPNVGDATRGAVAGCGDTERADVYESGRGKRSGTTEIVVRGGCACGADELGPGVAREGEGNGE